MRPFRKNVLRFLTAFLTVVVLLLAFPFAVKSVTFKDGKFDLVVMISEKEKENLTLVTRIEDEMKAASKYLWDATGKQHRFGTVTILIPKDWSDQKDYQPLKDETKKSADIEIGSHIKGASASGKKISISASTSILKGNGRVTIHEFGHAVYGLWDEYCDYQYKVVKGKRNRYQIFKKGGKWLKCTAKVDSETNKAEVIQGKPYHFTKRNTNGETASIMWVQWENSIVDFCDDQNHNSSVQTKQQRLHGESCQETMEKGKYSFKRTGGKTIPYTPPTIIKVKQSDLSNTVLVIDRSGSMQGSPLQVAKSSAGKHVQLTEKDNYIGVVSFSTNAGVTKKLTKITDSSKAGIQRAINGISADGWTSIGAGLLKGINQVESNNDPKYRKIIVVFTDGEENRPPYINSVRGIIKSKGIKVHGIGIGNIGSSNASLRSLCADVGGVYQTVNDYSDLPKVFNDIYGRVNPDQTVLFNVKENIPGGQTKTYQIEVDDSISDVLKFTVDSKDADDLGITLQMPDGTVLDENYQGYKKGNGFKLFQIDDSDITHGAWTLSVTVNRSRSTVTTISALAKSSIQVLAYVEKEEVNFPTPIHIMGVATKDGEVIQGLNAYAEITSPTGNVYSIPLGDDGVNGDNIPLDGSYEGNFYQFDGNGNYSITIFLSNESGNVAVLGAGFPDLIGDKGLTFTKIPPQTDRTNAISGKFIRQINAPSVTVSNYSYYQPIAPGRIDSLLVDSINGNQVVLGWTAPGEKGFTGTAQSYQMRYSTSPLTDENFDSGTEITGLPDPEEAGTYQTFTFTSPGNDIYYFAMRASNDQTSGDVSTNVVVATLVNLEASLEDVRSWLIKRKIGKITIKIGDIQKENIVKLVLCRKEAGANYSEYTAIKELTPADFQNGSYNFLDKQISKGKQYDYMVRALAADGEELMTSNVGSI